MWQCEECKTVSKELSLIGYWTSMTSDIGQIACIECSADIVSEHSNVIPEGWTEIKDKESK